MSAWVSGGDVHFSCMLMPTLVQDGDFARCQSVSIAAHYDAAGSWGLSPWRRQHRATPLPAPLEDPRHQVGGTKHTQCYGIMQPSARCFRRVLLVMEHPMPMQAMWTLILRST